MKTIVKLFPKIVGPIFFFCIGFYLVFLKQTTIISNPLTLQQSAIINHVIGALCMIFCLALLVAKFKKANRNKV